MTTTAELIDARYGAANNGDTPDTLPETVTQILGRRCIRRYSDKAIPDDLLDVLLACAQSAPTKSNLQQ